MFEIHDVLAYCSINLVKASAMASAAAAVEAKDWSKLVDIVLRGESELLVDKKSDDTEVQEFINNAAVFKIKITNIHEGNQTPLYSFWSNHVYSYSVWLSEGPAGSPRQKEVLPGQGQGDRCQHSPEGNHAGSPHNIKVNVMTKR
jgi:hypothetical protein